MRLHVRECDGAQRQGERRVGFQGLHHIFVAVGRDDFPTLGRFDSSHVAKGTILRSENSGVRIPPQVEASARPWCRRNSGRRRKRLIAGDLQRTHAG